MVRDFPANQMKDQIIIIKEIIFCVLLTAKNSRITLGKYCKVWEGQLCGVFCMMLANVS